MDEFNVNQIGSNLTAVANFYNHRRTELQKKIYSNAFGASNGYIISYLCENEDKNIFQRDIEREFDLSRSTVSTILKELEKEGLIERKSVIIDVRLKKVVSDDEFGTFVKVLNTLKKNSERIRNDISRDIY